MTGIMLLCYMIGRHMTHVTHWTDNVTVELCYNDHMTHVESCYKMIGRHMTHVTFNRSHGIML
jgi:hypothetical protein